jgi:hypothetical protein
MPDINTPINTEPPKPKPTDPKDIVTVDLFNPLRARRVIYDGIMLANGTMRPIVVESGETKTGVKLHKNMELELRDRVRAKKDSDLVVTRSNDSQAA